MRRSVVVAAVAVTLLAATPAASAAVTTAPTGQLSAFPTQTVDGVTYPLGADDEQRLRTDAQDILRQNGVETPDHAMRFTTHDGQAYLLLTEREPVVASAVGEVRVLAEPSSSRLGIAVAADVRYDTTGERVPFAELHSNPEQYYNRFVQVRGTVRSLSYTVDGAENRYVLQRSFFTLAPLDAPARPWSSPGRQGRWATLNLSGDEYGQSRVGARFDRAYQLRLQSGGQQLQRRAWWQSGNATIDAVVRPGQGGGGAFLLAGDVRPEVDTVAQSTDVARRLPGDRVELTASGVGAAISTQETLLNAAQCAPSSVTIPSPPGCLPIPADAVVHVGVFVDGSGFPLPYAGLSNTEQSQPVRTEVGRYRVRGRVADAIAIDPRLSSKAIIVHNRQRVGGFAAGPDARAQAARRSEQIKTNVREQQTATRSEWVAIQQRAAETPTPTPTPTPTTTPTATPTARLTPTSTDTPTPAPAETNSPPEVLGWIILIGIFGGGAVSFTGAALWAIDGIIDSRGGDPLGSVRIRLGLVICGLVLMLLSFATFVITPG